MKISLKEIIEFLGDNVLCVLGDTDGVFIQNIKDVKDVDENSLDWVNPLTDNKQEIVKISKAKVLLSDNSVLYNEELRLLGKVIIHVDNPKLCIAKVAHHFFERKYSSNIHPSVTIEPSAIIGENVYIGPNTVIEECKIGNNVIIHGNSFIYQDSIIGDNVEIHAGVIVGSEAHNYVDDAEGGKVKFPHIGRVIIADDVVIGANSVISRGVLSDTVIGAQTKIAQLVFIGANNTIGCKCVIRPNVMTSGSVTIEDGVIVANSVTIREKLMIGARSTLGMGAVIIRNVPSEETWVGNPARKLK